MQALALGFRAHHVAAHIAVAQAHETFLRFTAGTHDSMTRLLAAQNALLEQVVRDSAPLEDSGRGVTARYTAAGPSRFRRKAAFKAASRTHS